LEILWTFDNQEKLLPFTAILRDNDIAYELWTKGKQVSTEDGLLVAVDETDYKRAKKLLMKHRRQISNRHNS
jgi:hypothetical protein